MRIIESRSIDNQAGLLGSRLITGTNAIEGAFQSFIVAEDTVVTKVYNSIGIDVTSKLGLTSITLKAGAFISMPKGDYFSSIKLASGSIVAYFTSHGGQTITVDAYLNEFLARVGSSYLEASECVKAHLQQLINIGLLQKASLIMSPSMYEEDLVKSVVPQDGNGDLSFTRASNGTRVNSAGLVEVCPWNLASYSEQFNNSAWTKLNATITANSVNAPNGTTTADKITNDATVGNHFVRQSITSVIAPHTLSVYIKAGTKSLITIADGFTFNDLANFNLATQTATNTSGTNATIVSVGDGWYRCSVTMTPTTTTIGLMVFSGTTYAGTDTSGTFYIWGAQLNIGSTAKPYFPTTDRLNVPRLTYQNGGGGCPSLLLEKQSTNLVKYSEQFDNTGQWNPFTSGTGSVTITANYATSPDGTQNADRLQLNGGSGYAFVGADVTVTNGTIYTYSVWLKALSGTPNVAVIFDGSTVQTATLTSEWARYTFNFTGTGGATYPRVGVWQSNWGTSLSADVLAWGAQLEASSYATSYIPTTSSSATRVADGSPDTATLLSNKLSYSVFLDFYPRPLGNFQYFFIQKNSSANAEIIWGGTSGGTDFAIYDYTAGSICNVAINDGNRHKIVLSQASGKIDVFVDGSQVATQKTTSATGFYYVAFDGNPGIYKINELAIMSKITNADAIALTTL